MNNFTNSFTYLKHRERYIRAAKLRNIKKKLAAYNITLWIPAKYDDAKNKRAADNRHPPNPHTEK